MSGPALDASLAPPTGEVALVFTDIQGSTRLWEKESAGMRSALDVHNAVIRRVLESSGGYEVKTEGDAFMVAFRDPLRALRASLAAQEALLAADWPAPILEQELAGEERGPDGKPLHRGLRVRMGIHFGEPECRLDPVTGRMDYFGPMVNRAARIGAAGHGGQIVVSEAVFRKVEAELESLDSPACVDLGEHRLKDLDRVERLFQVLPGSLAARRFPRLRSLDPKKTNLTPHATEFVGREDDLAALHAIFEKGERLVTLMGPGGTGKTRLSMRYAGIHLDDFSREGAGGAWFCDLTESRTVDGVCSAVGRALDVPLTSGKSSADMVEQLGYAIAGRGRVLLVLDNFEQVAAYAGDTVARWMTLAPEALFLISSQERLRLPGETTYEVGPLGLPAEGESADRSEAVRLFVERARAVRRDYALNEADAPAVAEIVRQLDGIPLAIELAASRMGVLSPAKLLERLPRRFDLLGGARRDATSRQATLRGAIDWSWNLLQTHEQDALAQCSVFHGGFSLEAAEEVVDLSKYDGAPWPMDVVESLRDKSLLRAWSPKEFPGELRFGMYSNIREYAAERLEKSGAAPEANARHTSHYLRVAEEWADGIERRGGLERLNRLVIELENLMSVFQRASAAKPATVESATESLRAVLSLDPVLGGRGPFGAHLTSLDTALAITGGLEVDRLLKARVLDRRAGARRNRGMHRESLDDFQAALAIAREAKDQRLEIRTLYGTALLKQGMGELVEAERLAREAFDLSQSSALRPEEANVHGLLGILAMAAGRQEEAEREIQSALRLHRELGNRRFEGLVLGNLGTFYLRQADLPAARHSYELALEISREFGERRFVANIIGSLAALSLEENRYEDARAHYDQAIATHRESGNRLSLAFFLGNRGILEILEARFDDARSDLSASIDLFRQLNDSRHEALYSSYLGAAEASSNRESEAGEAFGNAKQKLDALESGESEYRIVLKILTGMLEIGQARRLRREGDLEGAERCLTEARRRAWGPGETEGTGPLYARQSEDVRLALRILESALEP